jgi:toxin ParE1/3/4
VALLRFSPDARADLLEIAAFIAQHNPRAAARLVVRLEETCRLLATRPLIGRRRDDIEPDLHDFPVGNYLFLYDIIGGIEIVRIVHGARDLKRVFQD